VVDDGSQGLAERRARSRSGGDRHQVPEPHQVLVTSPRLAGAVEHIGGAGREGLQRR
jgi:hypothetical protein